MVYSIQPRQTRVLAAEAGWERNCGEGTKTPAQRGVVFVQAWTNRCSRSCFTSPTSNVLALGS